MDYVKNGDYYIIGKYRDIDNPLVIELDQNWYLNNGIKNNSRGNDLASIDLVTMQFKSLEEFKKFLIEKGYLKNELVDLYIVHKKKYNNKTYVNEYELVFNEHIKRTELLKSLAQKRLKKEDIKIVDISNLIDRWASKIENRKSFNMFFTLPFKPNDEMISTEILKEEKSVHSLKYNPRIRNYTHIRNLVYMWNLYDRLKKKYELLDEINLGKTLTQEYTEILNMNNYRKTYMNEVEKIISKNQIPGQITIESFLNGNEVEPILIEETIIKIKENNLEKKEDKKENFVSEDEEILSYAKNLKKIKEQEINDYKNSMKELYEEERTLKNSEFDSPFLRDLLSKKEVNRYNIISYIPSSEMKKLTIEDRCRLGLIDYVDYLNLKEENKTKKWKKQ